MIPPETRVQIRRYFYAEHWKIGTIAQALNVHPDTVRRAIEVERFQHAEPLRPSIVDPYLPLVRETLEQHPRLRATRLYRMIRDRGYAGSVEQLRRVVARLRPQPQEAFLRLRVFPAEHYGESGVMLRTASPVPSPQRRAASFAASNFP
jgi:transposase